jgi:hypothetical protein
MEKCLHSQYVLLDLRKHLHQEPYIQKVVNLLSKVFLYPIQHVRLQLHLHLHIAQKVLVHSNRSGHCLPPTKSITTSILFSPNFSTKLSFLITTLSAPMLSTLSDFSGLVKPITFAGSRER